MAACTWAEPPLDLISHYIRDPCLAMFFLSFLFFFFSLSYFVRSTLSIFAFSPISSSLEHDITAKRQVEASDRPILNVRRDWDKLSSRSRKFPLPFFSLFFLCPLVPFLGIPVARQDVKI